MRACVLSEQLKDKEKYLQSNNFMGSYNSFHYQLVLNVLSRAMRAVHVHGKEKKKIVSTNWFVTNLVERLTDLV